MPSAKPDRIVTLKMTESRLLWLICVMYDRRKKSAPERDYLAKKLREALPPSLPV
jgi:hypothetical protein